MKTGPDSDPSGVSEKAPGGIFDTTERLTILRSVYILESMVKQQVDTMTADQIRQFVTDSGLSYYRIAKESGVPQPVVSRFMSGQQDILLGTAEKLAAFLGLRLVKTKGRK